tara:strand:- start:2290 stop:2454 length:165 start_codon:yes stop_codon:yes gene_type:complete
MDVRTNQSYQTKDAVLKYYEYRVDALLKRVEYLESEIKFKDGQLDTISKELNIY